MLMGDTEKLYLYIQFQETMRILYYFNYLHTEHIITINTLYK